MRRGRGEGGRTLRVRIGRLPEEESHGAALQCGSRPRSKLRVLEVFVLLCLTPSP